MRMRAMKTEIIRCGSEEIECYACGSNDVFMICHHCGRGICRIHATSSLPKRYYFIRSESREYTGLDLREIAGDEIVVHCDDCRHDMDPYELALYIFGVFGILAIIGSFRTIGRFGLLYGLLGLSVTGIVAWALYLQHQYYYQKIQKNPPPIPVFGRFVSVATYEAVRGMVELNAIGEYDVSAEQPKGFLKFSLHFATQDRERLEKYRAKYKLPRQVDLKFHAGFIGLHGINSFYLENYRLQPISRIALSDHVANQRFLADPAAARNRQWLRSYGYSFKLDQETTAGLPVQIIPTLISERQEWVTEGQERVSKGQEWALELFVQLNPKIDTTSLLLPRIVELKLEAPHILGVVESQDPAANIDYEQGSIHITWKNVELRQSRGIPYGSSFYIRFSKSADVEPTIEVSGKLRAQFQGTISGLDEITFFSPLGNKTEDRAAFVKHTDVEIVFNFDLRGLRLRQIHVIPERIEQPTAIPGDEMITRLVNALNDRDIYVQRVIENPSHTNRANAHIMNRLWVVAGRRYKEAWPIDFRIIAMGQEQFGSTDRPYDGNTQFKITTQGMITEKEMIADIARLKNDIVETILCTPDFKVEVDLDRFFVGEWGKLVGLIENTGEVVAQGISISAFGGSVKCDRAHKLEKLRPGDKAAFQLHIRVDEAGSVPVIVTITCYDEFGQLPSHNKRFDLLVEKKPASSAIGNQTNFYASSSGPIHTSSGNIIVGDEDESDGLSA